MALSDPTTDVPTPTGTLQGVAAFSWDGTNWQPSGRAGPSVATPTGVLRGVAAFNGGPAWQPSGIAQPSVATPTGALDGVAVYTWSGSAWTPPGGQPTPSTPSGALRGVAAFNWDGAAWQPAAQAGPSVATPYGVLDGVAMFGWSGSAWAAVGAPSLSLDFMTPGALDPRITFTRASTATYTASNGLVQSAAVNAPRWDYNPSTLALQGLLIEEARTNLWLQSADASNAAWVPSGGVVAAPVATGNQAIAPDGTLTAAQVVYPAVSGASAYSELYQGIPTTASTVYTHSMWLKGAVGGEQVYIAVLSGATGRQLCTLTTQWQRFSYTTGASIAGTGYFLVGVDLRDGPQTSKPAQTVYVWGGQVEVGAFATSYIPTIAAAVTRAAEQCYIPVAAWFTASAYSLMTEILFPPGGAGNGMYSGIGDTNFNNASYLSGSNFTRTAGTNGGVVAGPALVAGSVNKTCGALNSTTLLISNNAAAVVSLASTAATQTTATRMTIGCSPWGLDSQLNGYIRRARYWPRVLSTTELQAVTT